MLCVVGVMWLQESMVCCVVGVMWLQRANGMLCVVGVMWLQKSQWYVVCCWCHVAIRVNGVLLASCVYKSQWCVVGVMWLQELCGLCHVYK